MQNSKKAGYFTIHLGKYGLQGWGHSPDKWAGYPTKRGFDYFYGSVRHVDGHQHYPANFWEIGDNKSHQGKKEVWENNKEVSSGWINATPRIYGPLRPSN